MTNTISQDLLQAICTMANDSMGSYSFRNDYSGRSMFGERCFGVTCDNPSHFTSEVTETIISLHQDEDPEKALELIKEFTDMNRHMCTDSMGLEKIAYWPGYNISDEDMEKYFPEDY